MAAVFSEGEIVVRRLNDENVTFAVLTQGAIISCLDKKGNRLFQKLIKDLGGDTKKIDKKVHERTASEASKPRIKGNVDPRIPARKNNKRQPLPPRPAKDLLK